MRDRNQWSNDATSVALPAATGEDQRLEIEEGRRKVRRIAAAFATDADDLRLLLATLGLHAAEPVGRVVTRCIVSTCNRTMLGLGGADDTAPGGRGMCNRCYRIALRAEREEQVQ